MIKAAVAYRVAASLTSATCNLAQHAAKSHIHSETSPGRPILFGPSACPALQRVAHLDRATLAKHAAEWEKAHGVQLSP